MAKKRSSPSRVSLRRGGFLWLSCLSVLAAFSVVALARSNSAPFVLLYPRVEFGEEWKSRLILLNSSPNTSLVRLLAYDASGALLSEITEEPNLAPGERRTYTKENRGWPLGTVALKIESDTAIYSFVLLESDDGTALETIPPTMKAAPVLTFPIDTGVESGWRDFFLINVGAASTPLRVIAIASDGTRRAETALQPLAPMASAVVAVNDLFPSLILDSAAVVQVVGDQPLAGLQLFGADDETDVATLPALDSGQQLFLPVLHQGEGVELWTKIGLFNPRDGPVSIIVEAFDTQNRSIVVLSDLISLPARASHFLLSSNIGGVLPPETASISIIADHPLSAYSISGVLDAQGLTAVKALTERDPAIDYELMGSGNGRILVAAPLIGKLPLSRTPDQLAFGDTGLDYLQKDISEAQKESEASISASSNQATLVNKPPAKTTTELQRNEQPPSAASLAITALQLQAFWDQGQFWVPQTYDNHWVPIHPSGWEWARKAVDFYYANPQSSNILEVNPEGGRGKNIRAVHGGIAQIKAVRFNGSCGATSEQADLIITSGTLRTGYSHLEPNSPIRINDSVTVYTKEDVPLNLRQCAGTSCAVITTLSDGTRMNVIGGPLPANGFTWWQLQRDVNGVPQPGWAIEGDGVRKTLVNSLIHLGDQIVVYDPGGPGLNLRQCAGTSCPTITTMPIDGNTRMNVIGGPTQANNFTWWRLQGNVSGVLRTGWAVDAFAFNDPTLGKDVQVGDVIGFVSDQGCANSPHLHFNVWDSETPQPFDDPTKVLLGNEVIFPDSPPFDGVTCRNETPTSFHGNIYRCDSMPRGSTTLNALELTKAVYPDPVRPGGLLTYTLTVSNRGTTDLTGVVLTDVVPAGVGSFSEAWIDGGDCPGIDCNLGEQIRWNVGTVFAGQSVTKFVTMTVLSGSSAPPDGTLIRNNARVTADGGLEALAERPAVVNTTPVLILTMVEDREPVMPGELLTYTLSFGNRGAVNAPGVTLSVTLPEGTILDSVSDGGVVTDGVVSWSLGTVSVGKSGQRQFTVRVNGGVTDGEVLVSETEIRDTASPENSARATAVTVVQSIIPLTLEKSVYPDPVRPGGLLTYTLTVSNRGTTARTGVVLTDVVPAGVGSFSEAWIDGGDCPGIDCNLGEQITWNLGTVFAGQSVTKFVTMPVASPPDSVPIRNSVRVRADGGLEALAERPAVVNTTPVLILTMVEDREPVMPGELLTYTLSFGNRGAVNAPGVTLSATLPEGATFISASDGGTAANGVVDWALGTVGVGKSGQRQFTVRVDGGTDGKVLVSEAEIRDTASSDDSARATAVTAVRSDIPLTLTKTIDLDTVRPGEPLMYTLMLHNRGAIDLPGVVLTDVVPLGVASFSEAWIDGGDCPGIDCNLGEQITWNLGTVFAGQSVTKFVTIPVVSGTSAPPDGALIRNSVRVRTDGGLEALAGTITRVCAAGGTACDHAVILPQLLVSISGNGTVTSIPSGINCPGDCVQSYTLGTVVKLMANPTSGWNFTSWGGDCAGQGNPCSLTMTGLKNAIANFTCTSSILPTGQSFSASGSTGNVSVTALNGCSWTAVSNSSWLTNISGSPGNGSGTVGYTVAANPGPNPRRGTMTIAGKPFTVSQGSPLSSSCAIFFSPQSTTFGVSGGSGSITVIASSSTCPWTAVVNRAGWITITDGASGTGNGLVQYNVAANPGPFLRSGRILINGNSFRVTQLP